MNYDIELLSGMIQYEFPFNEKCLFRIESSNDVDFLDGFSPFIVVNDYYGIQECGDIVIISLDTLEIEYGEFNNISSNDVVSIFSFIRNKQQFLKDYFNGNEYFISDVLEYNF